MPIAWPADLAGVEALRIGLTTRVAGDRLTVRHIALYPPKGDRRALRSGIPPPAKVPRPRTAERNDR